MNFSVCLFNLLFCISLIMYYIWKEPPIDQSEDKICSLNILKYRKYLKCLLGVYVAMLIISLIFNKNICNNTFMLIFGFVTIIFITFIYVRISPNHIKCITSDVSMYFSLLPIIILGIISLLLGYLGNVLKK
jgi:hypothetical protein